MKVALVVHDLHEHAGHSLYTKVLAAGLSHRHDITVFANTCEREAHARWSFHPVRAWRVNALSCVKTFPLGLHAAAATLAGFDIRHMQGYCGGRPNVVTAHRCMAAYVRSLSSISLRHRFSLGVMLATESRFYRNYDGAVIAVSHQIAAELQESYGIRGPIRVIHHGVDAVRFNSANRRLYRDQLRRELGIKPDQTLAFYAGDMTKAHSHLKELSRAAPDIQILIATSSKSYHWKAPNVRIVPLTTVIERYYAAADSFVFPSVNDPFGLVVLEAMASGLPVFCSDRAGASELITPGKDGFVIPLDQWVEATVAGLRDRDSLRAIGCKAEKTARRHDWSTVVAAVDQLYTEVAAA
jgi:UDP-glucose:(heptosyl)LPS alpha-1,3-glucosyltransferase